MENKKEDKQKQSKPIGIKKGLVFIVFWLMIDAVIFSVNILSKINFKNDWLGEVLYIVPFYFVFYFGCFLIILFVFKTIFKKEFNEIKNVRRLKKEDGKKR